MIGYAVRAEFRAVCFGMVMPSLTESACRWGEIPIPKYITNSILVFLMERRSHPDLKTKMIGIKSISEFSADPHFVFRNDPGFINRES